MVSGGFSSKQPHFRPLPCAKLLFAFLPLRRIRSPENAQNGATFEDPNAESSPDTYYVNYQHILQKRRRGASTITTSHFPYVWDTVIRRHMDARASLTQISETVVTERLGFRPRLDNSSHTRERVT
jgi:hypothetical protein